MLQKIVLAGRFYIKHKNNEVKNLVNLGHATLHQSGEKYWLVPTEKGIKNCPKEFPPLPELDEFELTIYNQIRLYAKGNKNCTQDDLWNNLLKHFPGKFKTIREVMTYYTLTAIKDKM